MNSDHSIPKNHRYRFPVVCAILAMAALFYVNLKPEFERNFAGWLTSAIVLFVVLITAVWFVLLSGFSRRARLLALLGVALAFAGFKTLLRVDGALDGRGLPRFTWKWTPPRDATLKIPANGVTVGADAEVPVPPGAADVPQFLGLHRDGFIRGANLSRDWLTTPPKELWRQPVGIGWSAFSVVGGRAYTQEQRGPDELVTCYELATGRLLWSHANAVRFVEWQGGDGPRATPTVEGGRVYAVGATGILDCLDAVTGKPIWSRDLLKENQARNITWGVSASPLIVDDRVIVTAGSGSASLLAFNKTEGTMLWKGGTDVASYASPVLATIAGRRGIVSLNAVTLTIHDPDTGGLLLDYKWKEGKFPKAAQPSVVGGDRIFLSGGYGYGCVMLQIKAAGDRLAATELWQNNKLKAQFNSIGVRDGFLYGLDDGTLAGVDGATGERKWKEGRHGSGQTLLVDDLMLVQDEQGPVVLVEPRPDGVRELGRIAALSGKTWNHPVLAGRYLLVRNDHEAACYELPVNRALP
jgi:outer membrane protein assembly factor BamB